VYQNILAQPAEPTSPNRTPSIAASGLPAWRISKVPLVTRQLDCDKSSVGYCSLTSAGSPRGRPRRHWPRINATVMETHRSITAGLVTTTQKVVIPLEF
jgi:hypothetical protein